MSNPITHGLAAIITYGATQIDLAKTPDVSVESLLTKGAAHFFGNEMASKITAWKAKALADGLAEFKKANPAATEAELADAAKGFEPTEEAIAAKRAEVTADALADVYAGEIGSGRGPRLDPVDRMFNQLVDKQIASTLEGANIKFPKGRKLPTEDEVVNFANGETRTLAQMRTNTAAKHGDRLRKEAEKRVADEKKKAEQAKAAAAAAAASATGFNPADAGL